MEYEPVIGLEVHAQLLTSTKIFCGCSTRFGARPNSHTCPVCLGLPGALPVLNRKAVDMAVRAGLALGCRINQSSLFARKNYFYPDLPKGFQISQYDLPLAQDGCLEFSAAAGSSSSGGKFRINRIHLEDDAGKSVHSAGGYTQVNLNRTGTPLIEIVTEADFRSADEAVEFLSRLRQILLYLGICDGNMEEGSLRCDANVSIRPVGSRAFGTKTEIKNLNSFRFLKKALEFELGRQEQVLRGGGRIEQETRLWDEDLEATRSMRSKEEAHDYRYFPEPDLLPVAVSDEWLQELKGTIPELPAARRDRFVGSYGLSFELADLLTQSREWADYFEEAVEACSQPVRVANWMVGDLTRDLKRDGLGIGDSPVSAEHLAGLVVLIEDGTISGKSAKEVFVRMYEKGEAPQTVVDELELRQISKASEIRALVDRVVSDNPDKVEAFRKGKHGLMGFFVGQVMRESRGQANPKLVNELLLASLSEES